MAFTTISITGTFHHPDGSNATGTIVATPSSQLQNGTTIIDMTPVVGQITAGALTMSLVATDDTGTTPTGAYYTWVVQLDGIAPIEAFTAPLSHLTTPVDFSTFAPVVVSSPLSATFSLAALDARYASINSLPTVTMPAPSGDTSGVTDAAHFTSALATLPGGRGTLQFQNGTYYDNTQRVLGSYLTLAGTGGLSGGATPGTLLQYVGTAASYIKAQGAIGFQLRDMMVFSSSASFTGVLVDVSAFSPLVRIERCTLFMTATATGTCISLDNSLEGVVYGCNIVGGQYGIQGTITTGHTAAGVTVLANRIGGQGASGACIKGVGAGWSIDCNIFEMQNGQFVIQNGVDRSQGCSFTGNWIGDATGSPTLIQAGDGWAIEGNWIGNTGTGTSVDLTGVTGTIVKGNNFTSGAVGIKVDATTLECQYTPNQFVGTTLRISTGFDPALANATPAYGRGFAGVAIITNDLYQETIRINDAVTLTGIEYYGTVASGNVIVALYNGLGTRVAVSNSTAAGANAKQVPFTATYRAQPGVYYIGIMFDNNTQTVEGAWSLAPSALSVQGGFSSPASITPPSVFQSLALPYVSTY